MKCNKCDAPAEYDCPESLCGKHWAQWMAFNNADDPEDTLLTVREQHDEYRDIMRMVNKERRKDARKEKV